MQVALWVLLGLFLAIVFAGLVWGKRREAETHVDVPDDDPDLLEAEAEARRRWPEFADAFASRQEGESYFVKVKVAQNDRSDHIWMNVSAIDDGQVTGKLNADPITVTNVQAGDEISRPSSEIEDWLITRTDGTMQGGYTMKVLMMRGRG